MSLWYDPRHQSQTRDTWHELHLLPGIKTLMGPGQYLVCHGARSPDWRSHIFSCFCSHLGEDIFKSESMFEIEIVYDNVNWQSPIWDLLARNCFRKKVFVKIKGIETVWNYERRADFGFKVELFNFMAPNSSSRRLEKGFHDEIVRILSNASHQPKH